MSAGIAGFPRVLSKDGFILRDIYVFGADGWCRRDLACHDGFVVHSSDVAEGHEVDGRGQWATPVVTDCHTHLGMYEHARRATVETFWELPYLTDVEPLALLRPDDRALAVAAAAGFGTVVTDPGSTAVVSGHGYIVDCLPDGGRIRGRSALKCALGDAVIRFAAQHGTRMRREGLWQLLYDGLRARELFLGHAIKVHAYRWRDLLAASLIARDLNLGVTALHAAEVVTAIDRGAAFDAVVFGPINVLPLSEEALLVDAATVAQLVRWGIPVCLTSDAPVRHPRDLRHDARSLLETGLCEEEALACITTSARRILGLAQGLQPGDRALFSIYSSNPLDTGSREIVRVSDQSAWFAVGTPTRYFGLESHRDDSSDPMPVVVQPAHHLGDKGSQRQRLFQMGFPMPETEGAVVPVDEPTVDPLEPSVQSSTQRSVGLVLLREQVGATLAGRASFHRDVEGSLVGVVRYSFRPPHRIPAGQRDQYGRLDWVEVTGFSKLLPRALRPAMEQLVEYARKVVDHLGSDVDIEWAYGADGRFHLLEVGPRVDAVEDRRGLICRVDRAPDPNERSSSDLATGSADAMGCWRFVSSDQHRRRLFSRPWREIRRRAGTYAAKTQSEDRWPSVAFDPCRVEGACASELGREIVALQDGLEGAITRLGNDEILSFLLPIVALGLLRSGERDTRSFISRCAAAGRAWKEPVRLEDGVDLEARDLTLALRLLAVAGETADVVNLSRHCHGQHIFFDGRDRDHFEVRIRYDAGSADVWLDSEEIALGSLDLRFSLVFRSTDLVRPLPHLYRRRYVSCFSRALPEAVVSMRAWSRGQPICGPEISQLHVALETDLDRVRNRLKRMQQIEREEAYARILFRPLRLTAPARVRDFAGNVEKGSCTRLGAELFQLMAFPAVTDL